MTDQHRATPEQWASQKAWAVDDDDSACLIDLHARVEALCAHVAALREEMRDRTDTLAAADGDTTSLIFKVTNRIEALERSATTPEPHAASAEARPAGGLVERVRRVIGDDAPCSHSNARAAIREVAAWLEARGNRGSAAELRQEADRG